MEWRILFIVLFGIVDLGLTAPVYFNKRLEEAEQVALESTGLLQPLDVVVRRIMGDLKAIRAAYPSIENVVHKKKWVPGEVVLRSVSDTQINQIDDSRIFGPLQAVRKVRTGSGPTVLVFSQAYNPERVAERLSQKFGLLAEPNTNSEDILVANGSIKYNPSTGIYTIEQKPKTASYAGFKNKFFWEFRVQNGKVNLLRSMKPGFEFGG